MAGSSSTFPPHDVTFGDIPNTAAAAADGAERRSKSAHVAPVQPWLHLQRPPLPQIPLREQSSSTLQPAAAATSTIADAGNSILILLRGGVVLCLHTLKGFCYQI